MCASDERRPVTPDDTLPPATAPLTERDRARFEDAVLPHLDAAYSLARHILRDADDAADATQEALLKAARGFGGFRGGEARAWVLAIVRNACLSHLRRRKSRGEMLPFDEEIGEGDDPPASAATWAAAGGAVAAIATGPEADLVRTVARETLQRGLEQLPLPFREAIVLRELEDLSYKEIAHVTGVPLGTVMSRLARARRMLADALTRKGRP